MTLIFLSETFMSQEVSRATRIPEDRLYSASRECDGARGRGIVGYLWQGYDRVTG